MKTKNRLNLDFSLDTVEERTKFIEQYLQSSIFKKVPLSLEEIELCGNYILWGKDTDGKNGVQKKEYQIQSKNNTWNKKEVESLDALLEAPAFNEALIMSNIEAKTKINREVFSREEALNCAPPAMKEAFIQLFREIDETDLILNYYDLAHGKRKNQPRKELLSCFTQEEQNRLKEASTHLNQYQYLKMRHKLVELRRQQFSLRDSYSNMIIVDQKKKVPIQDIKNVFNADIPVYPFGLIQGKTTPKFFISYEEIIPNKYQKEEIEKIIKYYWENQKCKENYKLYFDFEDLEHVYNLLLLLFEIDLDRLKEVDDTFKELIETLYYYIDNSDLTDVQLEILKLKISHKKNQDIASYINQKYNKSYTANYISTIFRQKIIKKINESATYHKELILNLTFPENFKNCSCCHAFLLKHSHNFVRKTRSKDGYTNRCKKCDKIDRENKKGGIQ